MRVLLFIQTVIRFLGKGWLAFSVTQDLIRFFRENPDWNYNWLAIREFLQQRQYSRQEIDEAVHCLFSLQQGVEIYFQCVDEEPA